MYSLSGNNTLVPVRVPLPKGFVKAVMPVVVPGLSGALNVLDELNVAVNVSPETEAV